LVPLRFSFLAVGLRTVLFFARLLAFFGGAAFLPFLVFDFAFLVMATRSMGFENNPAKEIDGREWPGRRGWQ
jgi:uncharacterized membrane protein (DUF2068 family)